MAFFQEELYDPTSRSRNIWEESEESPTGYATPIAYYKPIFKWDKMKEVSDILTGNKLKVQRVIIGFEGVGSIYLNTVYKNATVIGSLLLPEMGLKENKLVGGRDPTLKDKLCRVIMPDFSKASSAVVVICSYAIDVERAFTWTNTLFNHISASEVIVLDGLNINEFKVGSADTVFVPPILRKCESSSLHKASSSAVISSIEALECPTLLEGASAAVLAHCERRRLKCLVCVSLSEARLDVASLLAFHAITPLLPSSDALRGKEKAVDDMLQSIAHEISDSHRLKTMDTSNLFM